MADPGDELNPPDPDEDFQHKFFRRLGPLGEPFVVHEIKEDAEKRKDTLGGEDLPFEPRPEVKMEDQRGLSFPQLDLQARFIKSRGLREPTAALDPTLASSEPAKALGADTLAAMPQTGAQIPYLLKTDNPKAYDTPLNPQEEKSYQKWAKGIGKKPQDEEQDYDLRGYYKWQLEHPQPPDLRNHLIDLFKKPNHPTFSDQSMYHNFPGGMEREEGGHWGKNADGSWTFTAGKSNLARWNPSALQHYFDKYEKGNRLIIPQGLK